MRKLQSNRFYLKSLIITLDKKNVYWKHGPSQNIRPITKSPTLNRDLSIDEEPLEADEVWALCDAG